MPSRQTRRDMLKTGAVLAAAGALPRRASAGPLPLRGPRLLYARTGFFTAIGGFPTLLVYDDGLVVHASEPASAYPPPWQAATADVGPAGVRKLVAAVRATGVFTAGPLVAGKSGYDGNGEYLEAVIRGRKHVRYAYHVGPEDGAVFAAAKVVRSFIATLGDGNPYEPAGYLLDLVEDGPPAMEDPEPVPWPLDRRVPLTPLLDGFQRRLVLPPGLLPQLQTVGLAYTPLIVTSRDRALRVEWRPLYPHE